MSVLANIKVKDMERILLSKGFQPHASKGSHKTFKHLDGRRTTLAYHPGNIPKPIVAKILKQSGITRDELQKYRR